MPFLSLLSLILIVRQGSGFQNAISPLSRFCALGRLLPCKILHARTPRSACPTATEAATVSAVCHSARAASGSRLVASMKGNKAGLEWQSEPLQESDPFFHWDETRGAGCSMVCLGVSPPHCTGVWGFTDRLRQRQSSKGPKTSPNYCSSGISCGLSFSATSLACCSQGRVLPTLIHGSLIFHRDLAEGSCLASHDPASSPPSPHSPPQQMAPWKTQRARSPASWPVSGQGQGRGIPAPPPGNAPPCTVHTPAAAKNPPASHGYHPEIETRGCADPSLSRVCPSLGIFPFPQHHGQPQGGCGCRSPSCIPRRAAAACCGVNSGAAHPRGDRI